MKVWPVRIKYAVSHVISEDILLYLMMTQSSLDSSASRFSNSTFFVDALQLLHVHGTLHFAIMCFDEEFVLIVGYREMTRCD